VEDQPPALRRCPLVTVDPRPACPTWVLGYVAKHAPGRGLRRELRLHEGHVRGEALVCCFPPRSMNCWVGKRRRTGLVSGRLSEVQVVPPSNVATAAADP
jgi:hypothetical protein